MDPVQSSTEETPAPADPGVRPTCTTPQVLLGLLVVWQIVFLLASNTLNLLYFGERITSKKDVGAVVDHITGGFPEGKGHLYEAYVMLTRWEGVWNTPQSWRMFSPSVGDYFSFVRVEMRWDDLLPGAKAVPGGRAPVVLKGMNEPDDFDNYVRMGPWRFQRYEDYFIGMNFRVDKGETAEKAAEGWKSYIEDQVKGEWKCMNVYLNWRWRRYKEAHPDCPPPQQLILSVRTYVVGDPEEGLGIRFGPTEVPVVRWEYAKSKAGTWSDMQPWDPVARQWKSR